MKKKFDKNDLGRVVTMTSRDKTNPVAAGLQERIIEQEFNNLEELFDFFKDEKACLNFLEMVRWGDTPECPYCQQSKKIRRITKGYECGNKECSKQFTVLKATLFENTKLPLRSWFIALYLCTGDSHGINSCQMARYLGLTQKTTWFMLHRIRELFKQSEPKLHGVVEADETYIGGRTKNKHAANRKEKTQGRSLVDKVPVLGMVERGGNLVARAVQNVRLPTLKAVINNTVHPGSMLITDELSSYNFAKADYYHVAMKHNKDMYVNDEFHTNTIEGFWGMLKRGISGTFSHVGKAYLQRYLDEFVFRYNNRKLNASQRFIIVLKLACSHYLPYKKLKKEAGAQIKMLTLPEERKAA